MISREGGAKRWEGPRGYGKAVGEEKGFTVSMVVSCHVTLLSLLCHLPQYLGSLLLKSQKLAAEEAVAKLKVPPHLPAVLCHMMQCFKSHDAML